MQSERPLGWAAAIMCYTLVAVTPVFWLAPAGTLTIWAVRRKQEPFVDDHGRQALDAVITALLAAAALVGITTGAAWLADNGAPALGWLAVLGRPALQFSAVLFLLYGIWGAIQAASSMPPSIPLTLRIFRRQSKEAPPAGPPDA